MTSAFSLRLYEAILDGKIDCRLYRLALGDAVVSPGDQVLAWASFVYNFNLLDVNRMQEIKVPPRGFMLQPKLVIMPVA